MSVLWAASAADDLRLIAAHVAADDPVAAEGVVRKILDAATRLARHAGLGRPGRVAGTRELVIAGLPYIVPYRVRGHNVEILRVLHAARKWPGEL